VDMVCNPPERKQFGSLLLVDGHTLVAEGIAKLLESRFSRIWIASTAARFQELVSQVRPTLVIADLYLPGASCIALMEGTLQQEGAGLHLSPSRGRPRHCDPRDSRRREGIPTQTL